MSAADSRGDESRRASEFIELRRLDRRARKLRGNRRAVRAFLIAFFVVLLYQTMWVLLAWLSNPFEWRAAEMSLRPYEIACIVLIVLVGPFAAIVALIISDQSRKITLGLIPGVALGLILSWAIKERARPVLLDRFARDTAPFIAAFEAYFEDYKRVPESFDELVPDYLHELPSLPPLQAYGGQNDNWTLRFEIFETNHAGQTLFLCSEEMRVNYNAGSSRYDSIRPWLVLSAMPVNLESVHFDLD